MSKRWISTKKKTPNLDESPLLTLNLRVSDDGHLDVSNNGLSRISDRQMKNITNLSSVVSLNASLNGFIVIDFLKLLPNCRSVDASDNKIKRLLTFIQLKKSLEVLDVSYNQISSTEYYLSQLTQLKVLSIHHNSLIVFPTIDELTNLTCLDVSYNQLSNLPPVKRLPNLTFLALNGNRISSLRDIAVYLPTNLARLELAENLITDLTEVAYMKELPNLEEFSFASNPAVLPPNNRFNYRPYIVSKQLNLKMINSLEVSDEEKQVAEYLNVNKKINLLGPGEGNHTPLVKLLEIESPPDYLVETLSPTHSSLKAVQKNYLSNKSARASLSSISRICKASDLNIPGILSKTSTAFDESPIMPKSLDIPSCLISNDGQRSSSGSTVVMGMSISEAMNLACPRIDSADGSVSIQPIHESLTNFPSHVHESKPSTSNQNALGNNSIFPPVVSTKKLFFDSVFDNTIVNENYLSDEEGCLTNQKNKTFTIMSSSDENSMVSDPSEEVHICNSQKSTDIRIMKLENKVKKLESEINTNIVEVINPLIQITNSLTDLLVNVNMMVNSMVDITNKLSELLITLPMIQPSTTTSTVRAIPPSAPTTQPLVRPGSTSTLQVGVSKKENMVTYRKEAKYARNKKIEVSNKSSGAQSFFNS